MSTLQNFQLLVVPGLRDHVESHWQTHLALAMPNVRSLEPLGRDNLDLATRVLAIESAVRNMRNVVIVAHSAGTLMVAHWAARTRQKIVGALLAAPPDFETPMPEGYPSMDALRAAGWLPVPRAPLPFRSVVAASRNDPLATFERVTELCTGWGGELADLGEVGHLNPASGFGPWPGATELIEGLVEAECLATAKAQCWGQPLRY